MSFIFVFTISYFHIVTKICRSSDDSGQRNRREYRLSELPCADSSGEANERVGLAQAENIKGADIRIIAGALEAFAATEAGQSLLGKLGINLTETK